MLVWQRKCGVYGVYMYFQQNIIYRVYNFFEIQFFHRNLTKCNVNVKYPVLLFYTHLSVVFVWPFMKYQANHFNAGRHFGLKSKIHCQQVPNSFGNMNAKNICYFSFSCNSFINMNAKEYLLLIFYLTIIQAFCLNSNRLC